MSAPKSFSEFTAGHRPLGHFQSDSGFCKRKERALIRAEAQATVLAHDAKNRVFFDDLSGRAGMPGLRFWRQHPISDHQTAAQAG